MVPRRLMLHKHLTIRQILRQDRYARYTLVVVCLIKCLFMAYGHAESN